MPEKILKWLWSQHFFGALFLVLVPSTLIADQVAGRTDFANTELSRDVESRWGAPVDQVAPSVRFVQSGTVFTELQAMPLERQDVKVHATMNYRKRGLKYFSGFDFNFVGGYEIKNPTERDIDVVFVFPVELDKSQVLLSELYFAVDGKPESLDLSGSSDRLVWTGRLSGGKTAAFDIHYRARGLDSFVYHLDPALPARNVSLAFEVDGGDNYDYPPQVLAANSVVQRPQGLGLHWNFTSLESGVALGVILPSQKEYDALVATMARRAFFPALAFFAILSLTSLRSRRRLLNYETYLAAATFGFFFVLVAYLGAFMHFYLAYAIATLGLGAAVILYLRRIFPMESVRWLASLWVTTLMVPTLAVVLQGYTGLIYTLECLGALLVAMVLLTRPQVRELLSEGGLS